MSEAIIPGAINSTPTCKFTWAPIGTASNTNKMLKVALPNIGSYFMIFMYCKINWTYSSSNYSEETHYALIPYTETYDTSYSPSQLSLASYTGGMPALTLQTPIFSRMVIADGGRLTQEYATISTSNVSSTVIRESRDAFAISVSQAYTSYFAANGDIGQISIDVWGLPDPY